MLYFSKVAAATRILLYDMLWQSSVCNYPCLFTAAAVYRKCNLINCQRSALQQINRRIFCRTSAVMHTANLFTVENTLLSCVQ